MTGPENQQPGSPVPPGHAPIPTGPAQGLPRFPGDPSPPPTSGILPPHEGTLLPEGEATGRAPLAHYGPRLGAWVLDWVIVLIVTSAANAAFDTAKLAGWTFRIHQTHPARVTTFHYSVVSLVVDAAIAILYGGLLCGTRGQTVGMMALRLRAIDAESGSSIGVLRGLWRALFEYLCFIVFFVPWVIDMLFPLWDERNQTLHDKVSGTVVTRPALIASPAGA